MKNAKNTKKVAVKNNKNRQKVVVNDDIKIGSFIKILVGILIVLVCFTLITMFLTRDKSKKTKEDNTIQYTKIIAGSILNRPEEKYYVLVTKNSDLSTYDSSINDYNTKDGHLRIYKVDLDDPFNANYVSYATMIGQDMTDTKFADAVLLYIENGTIANYVFSDQIANYLNNLSA